MADFRALLTDLRKAEQHFVKQLAAIRAALASLELDILAMPFPQQRKRRHLSAARRTKSLAAQKKPSATQKHGNK